MSYNIMSTSTIWKRITQLKTQFQQFSFRIGKLSRFFQQSIFVYTNLYLYVIYKYRFLSRNYMHATIQFSQEIFQTVEYSTSAVSANKENGTLILFCNPVYEIYNLYSTSKMKNFNAHAKFEKPLQAIVTLRQYSKRFLLEVTLNEKQML